MTVQQYWFIQMTFTSATLGWKQRSQKATPQYINITSWNQIYIALIHLMDRGTPILSFQDFYISATICVGNKVHIHIHNYQSSKQNHNIQISSKIFRSSLFIWSRIYWSRMKCVQFYLFSLFVWLAIFVFVCLIT